MGLPTGWKCLTDKVTHLDPMVKWLSHYPVTVESRVQVSLGSLGITIPKHSLTFFFVMSVKLLALAAEIVDTNPAGSQLILNITNAETGAELIEALDNYDATVLENYTQPTEDVVEDEDVVAV
jgi:hypothetical protein